MQPVLRAQPDELPQERLADTLTGGRPRHIDRGLAGEAVGGREA